MISIRELARVCDVTEGTVSRALAGGEKVSAKTRDKILAAAKKFNYNPNRLVRGVFTGKTRSIGMTSFPGPDEFISHVLCGALAEVCRHDYRMMLMPWPGASSEPPDMIRKFNEYRTDGIILTPIIQQDFDSYRIDLEKYYGKVVVVDQRLPYAKCDFVGFDDLLGIRQYVDYLQGKKYRRIGWCCSCFCDSALRRYNDFVRVLGERRIFLDPALVINDSVAVSRDEFRSHITGMLGGGKPDAILAFNDEDAVFLLNIALDLGIRVPEELSIVGFGNLAIGRVVRPALSTICQNGELMGETAAGILIDRIQAPESGDAVFLPREILLETTFVPRGT